jgi:hypothetical protein
MVNRGVMEGREEGWRGDEAKHRRDGGRGGDGGGAGKDKDLSEG